MDINNFNFLSDQNIDKVIWSGEGVIPAGQFNTDVPTGTDELMLLYVAVSIDGSSWYSDAMPPMSSTGTSAEVEVYAYSAPNRVNLVVARQNPGPTHYRILGVRV